MSNPFIDYSQYKEFSFCEWKWYEKYIAQQRRAPKPGQQDDVLTLGSLTHAGLQYLREQGRAEVPAAAIIEHSPTPECLAWATQLVQGYAQTYPVEPFTAQRCEHAIRFPLIEGMDGLAKIDRYFHIDKELQLESGLGDSFVLSPGTYVHEYKTKAASRAVGDYIDAWKVNMQAAFQMLALQSYTGERPQGLLVNVLEKPQEYKPKHTCKACKVLSERREWLATGDGYACPSCGNQQKLDFSHSPKVARVAKYYRLRVTRSDAELEAALSDIKVAAKRMLEIRATQEVTRATERCVDQITMRKCDYFEPHTAERSAEGWQGFVHVEALKYVGEEVK